MPTPLNKPTGYMLDAAGNALPLVAGATSSVGTSVRYAREDHVHPSSGGVGATGAVGATGIQGATGVGTIGATGLVGATGNAGYTLYGRPVSAIAPLNGQVLRWDGSAWTPWGHVYTHDNYFGDTLYLAAGATLYTTKYGTTVAVNKSFREYDLDITTNSSGIVSTVNWWLAANTGTNQDTYAGIHYNQWAYNSTFYDSEALARAAESTATGDADAIAWLAANAGLNQFTGTGTHHNQWAFDTAWYDSEALARTADAAANDPLAAAWLTTNIAINQWVSGGTYNNKWAYDTVGWYASEALARAADAAANDPLAAAFKTAAGTNMAQWTGGGTYRDQWAYNGGWYSSEASAQVAAADSSAEAARVDSANGARGNGASINQWSGGGTYNGQYLYHGGWYNSLSDAQAAQASDAAADYVAAVLAGQESDANSFLYTLRGYGQYGGLGLRNSLWGYNFGAGGHGWYNSGAEAEAAALADFLAHNTGITQIQNFTPSGGQWAWDGNGWYASQADAIAAQDVGQTAWLNANSGVNKYTGGGSQHNSWAYNHDFYANETSARDAAFGDFRAYTVTQTISIFQWTSGGTYDGKWLFMGDIYDTQAQAGAAYQATLEAPYLQGYIDFLASIGTTITQYTGGGSKNNKYGYNGHWYDTYSLALAQKDADDAAAALVVTDAAANSFLANIGSGIEIWTGGGTYNNQIAFRAGWYANIDACANRFKADTGTGIAQWTGFYVQGSAGTYANQWAYNGNWYATSELAQAQKANDLAAAFLTATGTNIAQWEGGGTYNYQWAYNGNWYDTSELAQAQYYIDNPDPNVAAAAWLVGKTGINQWNGGGTYSSKYAWDSHGWYDSELEAYDAASTAWLVGKTGVNQNSWTGGTYGSKWAWDNNGWYDSGADAEEAALDAWLAANTTVAQMPTYGYNNPGSGGWYYKQTWYGTQSLAEVAAADDWGTSHDAEYESTDRWYLGGVYVGIEDNFWAAIGADGDDWAESAPLTNYGEYVSNFGAHSSNWYYDGIYVANNETDYLIAVVEAADAWGVNNSGQYRSTDRWYYGGSYVGSEADYITAGG